MAVLRLLARAERVQYAASGSNPARNFQQNYLYDGVNRLTYVNETGGAPTWTQSFNYDVVGNRWLFPGTAQFDATTPTSNVYTANNQIGSALWYDAKGNQTTDGGYTFTYDAENQLTATNMYGTTYGYDADGRRVTKTTNGVTTTYVYDVTGQLAAQYGTGGSTPCPATCYLMTDHLGSTRMQTDGGGNQVALFDYAPFGEELAAGVDGRDARWGGFGNGIHFTGKEQEGYEGAYMHYFGARYFSGGLGRFPSPDPVNVGADPRNPQSWNGYAYVRNAPLALVDPFGLSAQCSVDGASIPCSLVSAESVVQCPNNDCTNISGDAQGNIYRNTPLPRLSLLCGGADLSNYQCSWASWSRQFVQNGDSTYYVGTLQQFFQANKELWRNSAGAVNTAGAATVAAIVLPPVIGAVGGTYAALEVGNTMDVAIGAGDSATSPVHVAFRAGARWLHATGNFFDMTVESRGAAGFARGAWMVRTLPVLYPAAVAATEGCSASSCLTAAGYAFLRGWGLPF